MKAFKEDQDKVEQYENRTRELYNQIKQYKHNNFVKANYWSQLKTIEEQTKLLLQEIENTTYLHTHTNFRTKRKKLESSII